MKRILFSLLICCILLTACSPQTLVAAIPTASVEVSPTVTATPTETPTAIPTPTENPLAGAPDGTTGKNAQGEWTKTVTENDKEITYSWKDVPNTEIKGWYRSIIVNPTYEGGIPLIDQAAANMEPKMALNIFCEEGAQCPTSIQHVDNAPKDDTPTFSRVFIAAIEQRVLNKPVWKQTSQDDYNFAVNIWEKDAAEIPFTTAKGENYVYKIKPGNSMNIFIKKDALSDPDYNTRVYQSSISGDDAGNLYVVEYAKQAVQPQDFADIYFSYPFVLFYTTDMSQGSVQNIISSPNIAILTSLLANDKHQHLNITP